jgi:hypothetical protein
MPTRATRSNVPYIASLVRFYDLLFAHDWFFMMSDDHRVYDRGFVNEKKLIAMASFSVDHHNLYTQFHAHHFSGPNWPASPIKLPLPAKPRV